MERFRKMAVEHAFDWYKVAKEYYGKSIKNDSLYLITGFYKARSWSFASFRDATTTEPRHIRLVPREGEGTTGGGRWESTFPVDWHDGPGPGHNGNVNQTVFISGFKISVQYNLFGRLSRTPKVELVPDPRAKRKGRDKVGTWSILFGAGFHDRFRPSCHLIEVCPRQRPTAGTVTMICSR